MREFARPDACLSCGAVPAGLVVSYAHAALSGVAASSVEAHLPGCASCRSVLGKELDQARLERNRDILMTRLALPDAGPSSGPLALIAERVAARCGVPHHVLRLLAVTPSLRRSWLAGVILVLGVAVGGARLAAYHAAVLVPTGGMLPRALIPFLIIAPLLPLAGVAAAFHSRLDPAADLAAAAPISGAWLFCIRSVAVIGTALIPTVIAAFALPGSAWLPMLVVLPALTVSCGALALTTLMRPLSAALSAGGCWIIMCGGALLAGSPAAAYGGGGQAGCVGVLAAACSLLAARKRFLDFGWNR